MKKFPALSAAALLLTTTAHGQTAPERDPAVQQIIDELAAQGYKRIEVKRRLGGLKVEATGGGRKVEKTYDRDGNLIKEELYDGSSDVERYYDADGNLIKEEIGGDDSDDDDDDDYDDDDDSDHDDHDDDHGDDDNDDDDRDDDRDSDDNDDD